MYDKNCEQPEFKQSKSGMAQNNGLVYKEKQVDIEIQYSEQERRFCYEYGFGF